jgi:hypothetical protein
MMPLARVEMMSRKATYNSAKISSPTTSDGSNSSVDNNYSNGAGSPRRRAADNNGGSPGRSGGRHPSMAEFHSHSAGELLGKQPAPEETGGSQRSQRVYFSGSNGFPKGQGSPYDAGASPAPTPSPGGRLRDTPEHVANLVRCGWVW